jgi:hypothetical protein
VIRFTVVYPTDDGVNPLTMLAKDWRLMSFLVQEGLTEAAELLTDAAGKDGNKWGGCSNRRRSNRRRRAPEWYTPWL